MSAGNEVEASTLVKGSVGEKSAPAPRYAFGNQRVACGGHGLDAGFNVCALVGHWNNGGFGAARPWAFSGRGKGFRANVPADVFVLIFLAVQQ